MKICKRLDATFVPDWSHGQVLTVIVCRSCGMAIGSFMDEPGSRRRAEEQLDEHLKKQPKCGRFALT